MKIPSGGVISTWLYVYVLVDTNKIFVLRRQIRRGIITRDVIPLVELETPGTKSKLVELKKTYASSVRNQNKRVEADLAECEEIYPSTH